MYEVKILDYFSDFCDKNNLDYYLAYGTLLGAIRHKGFIPWDDDIDVYMTGKDYYLLKNKIDNISDEYFYQSLETEKYYNLTFAKIRLNGTKAIEEKARYEKIENKGIYIDIFPLIPYPDSEKERKLFWKKVNLLSLLIEADLVNMNKYKNYGKVGKILSRIFKVVPRKIRTFFARRLLKSLILYNGVYDNYVCIVDKKIFKKSFFNNSAKALFEGKKYKIPKEYDKYLEAIYGDYMQLPKIEDRKTHSFIEVDFGKDSDGEK